MTAVQVMPRRVAVILLAVALPLPVALAILAGSGRALILGCLVFLIVAATAGPTAWPGESRFECVVTCLAALISLIIGGVGLLLVSFLSLCGGQGSGDDVTAVRLGVAIVAVAAPYLLGSAWALEDSDRARWAWPVVIVLTLALVVAVTALVEGGPHHCET